jgi:erythromycin esterase
MNGIEACDSAFLRWARSCLSPLSTVVPGARWDDLASLGAMIGDARVVALTEAVHGGAEPLEFRNRVLQYLVEEKGFTAIAIESGIVESRAVYDYVRGSTADCAAVLTEGISWTFDRLPQNESLIRWLRQYNASHRSPRPVNFYGFDVPGSPGNPAANRGVDTALLEALKYLAGVDRVAAAAFHDRLGTLLPLVGFDPDRVSYGGRYDRLRPAERDWLTAAIADLVSLFERKESEYTAVSTDAGYAWAYRAALNARQVDSWLRQIPIGWQSSDNQFEFHAAANDIRDRAQADNLDWIIQQEGPLGKVVIFAHRYHLSAAPVRTIWAGRRQQSVAGTYLRRRYGRQLITIGNLIGAGEVECAGIRQVLKPPPPDSIEGLIGQLGTPLFLLDLRTAPSRLISWLSHEHQLGQGDDELKLSIGAAFDVIFYVDAIRPA